MNVIALRRTPVGVNPVLARQQSAEQSLTLRNLARLQTLVDASASLLRDGFEVLDLIPAAQTARPTLLIRPSARLAAMVERNEATYYSFGNLPEHGGAYRVGQFERCGARVLWIEQGVK